MGPLVRGSGCSACTACAWPWARFNACFATSDCPPAADPHAGTPPDEAVREGGAGRVDPGRRQVRADRGPLGVSVHRLGRLYALPDPAALPAAAPRLEPCLPRRAAAGVPFPHQAAAV